MLRDFNDNSINIIDGDLVRIKNWLNKNIHQLGRLYTPDDLAMKVTGEPLNPEIFINYLENKYSEIYHLN